MKKKHYTRQYIKKPISSINKRVPGLQQIFLIIQKQEGVRVAILHNNTKIIFKIPDICSIYMLEAYATFYKLKIIKKRNQIPKSIKLSDFLCSISNIYNINHQLNTISSKIHNLLWFFNYNNQIVLLT